MLSFVKYDEESYHTFKDGCFAEPSRFKKQIPRNNLHLFSSMTNKTLLCSSESCNFKLQLQTLIRESI